DELAPQLVQATKLRMLDRPLEESGDQGSECVQQVDLRRLERERLASLVARHEAEAAALADQRHENERADAEVPRDPLRQCLLVTRIGDERRGAGGQGSLEGAEPVD